MRIQLCSECERALFLSWVDQDDGCWLWTGATTAADGYGQYGRNSRAHRASWTLFRGPIPAGLIVRHRCDNRLCVNPDHLQLGTKADNSADMMRRGRCRVWTMKLDPEAVRTIRDRVASGGVQRHIAHEFGLHPQTVNRIVKRRSWKEVV